MRRIALINNDNNTPYRYKNNKYGGVGYYRLILPKRGLEKITDWQIDFYGSDFEKQIDTSTEESTIQSYVDFFKRYDLVILKHHDNPRVGNYICAASDITGTPFVTDLDDDVLSVREDQPAYKLGYAKGEVQRTTIATMLSFSKALFVTNEHLGKTIQKTIKDMTKVEVPYYVLPNCNALEDWNFKPKHNKNKVVIGWHGSITHNADLEMVFPVLKRILAENPNVKLELMGGISSEYALEVFKDWDLDLLQRLGVYPGTLSWQNFPYELMKKKWDIGIAPLIDDQFNKCKSNIKWFEYTMKKIPTVASNVLPYQSIETGKTGLLCSNTNEWYEALTHLIKNPADRQILANRAYQEVKDNWQYDKGAKEWKKAIGSVLKQK